MDRFHAVLAAAAFLAAIPAFGLEAPPRRAASRQLEVPRLQVARLGPPRSHPLATPSPARPPDPAAIPTRR